MSYTFTEGPTDQPWETTEDVDACWYVHRAGFWKRNRAIPPESTVVEDNFYVQGPKWATELAARLNDLDRLRAQEPALLLRFADALARMAETVQTAAVAFDVLEAETRAQARQLTEQEPTQ